MNNSPKKIKIAFVIPNLKRGGAEKVLTHFVNNIDYNSYEPVIFCQRKEGELISEINPAVQIVDLNSPRVYFIFFALRKAIKKYKPDVLISWMGHINATLAFLKPLLPVKLALMCRESSIPSRFISHYRAPGLFRFMYRFLNRYDGIICQSEAMKEDLVKNFNVQANKIKTIHNPVVINPGPAISANVTLFLRDAEKVLLYVGRFSAEKRAAITLEVMNMLPPTYKLVMLGYGPLENTIRETIVKKGLLERVLVIADCSNPVSFYKRADCLLLTSAFEGFPNVLLEANAMGCPVCVYKTSGGASEIIYNGNGIYINPNSAGGIEEFAEAIEKICTTPTIFIRPDIIRTAEKKFGVQEIIKQYLTYIEQVRTGLITA